jgi:sugar transferase (PEP-CTERM/EpsH1 system associated)
MSSGLHVAHVVLSLDVGGLERNVVNQIRVAGRTGQRVSVVCVERPGTLAPAAEALGARVVCLDKPPGLRFEVVGRMRAALRALRPDVVHTHQIRPLFYTGLATIGLRIPLLVHTEHGRMDYANCTRLRWLGRVAASRVAAFYCLSRDMRDWVAAHRIVARRKLRVVDNGIDTAVFRAGGGRAEARAALGIPTDAPVVGTVGRLVEVKRQDLLLRAFSQVVGRVPGAHLVLVGDGPRRSDLETLAGELGLSARVRFAGYRPCAAEFLRAMDAFALTSRSEGMPQSVLEASVSGTPVIAAAVGGIPEVISHDQTGLLFPAGDETALAAGLVTLLTDRDRATRLASAARSRVEARYSIGRMAAEYDADFRRLLDRRRRPAGPRVVANVAGPVIGSEVFVRA